MSRGGLTEDRIWYQSAQTIRVQAETPPETFSPTSEAIAEEPEDASPTASDPPPAKPPTRSASRSRSSSPRPTAAQARAAAELHAHELLALASCFAAPLAGAALLHAVRAYLSRSAEGLVSDYNLGVFLLAAEVRPLRHLLALVQARTLRLQRLVAAHPHLAPGAGVPGPATLPASVTARLDALEAALAARAPAAAAPAPPAAASLAALLAAPEFGQAPAFVGAARRAVAPELDALTRAVRRYEKRAAVLGAQTEGRLRELEARGRDALALAAAAERRGARPGVLGAAAAWGRR